MGIFDKLFGKQSKKVTPEKNEPVSKPNNAENDAVVVAGNTGASPSVRQRMAALKQNTHIDELLMAYENDGDDLVVDCADMCLREALMKETGDAYLEQLLSAKLSYKTTKDLAAKAKSKTLRHGLLKRINDDQSLNEVIAHTDDLSLKAAAIARLSDIDTLRLLIKRYKGKQKVIFRAAKNRLDELKLRRRQIDGIQAHIDALKAAAESETLSMSAVLSAEKPLTNSDDESLTQLSDSEKKQFINQLDELKAVAEGVEIAKSSRHQILQHVESATEALQTATFDGTRQDFHRLINDCQHGWSVLPAWQAAEAKALNIRFEQTLNRANEAAIGFFDEQQHRDAQLQLLSQCRDWLDGRTFISPTMLSDQERRWQDLPPLTEPSAQKSVQSEFSQLLTQLHDKSQQQIKMQAESDEVVPQQVEALATLIENGEVQHAIDLQTAIRERLQTGVSDTVYREIIGRLKRLEGRISELKRWQHFGDDQVRHEMIEAMRELAENSGMDIELKADSIQTLQKRWKALKGRAPNELWQIFKAQGDAAWEPCAAYFKARRQNSHSQLTVRLDFLNEAERQLQSVDWTQPNWATISEVHKKFEQVWRDFPKLQDQDYRKAKKAYQRVAKIWDEHLGVERKRELQRREALIATAQAQLDNDDTVAAIEVIKNLQKQWTPTVGLKRRENEQALWNRFKSACDAVFDQYGQARAEVQRSKNIAFEGYQTQLDALKALFDTYADDFEVLKQAFDEKSQALMTATFDDVSDRAARTLRAEVSALTQQFERHRHDVLLDKRIDYLAQLNSQDGLCIQLESTQCDRAQLDHLSDQWQSIVPLLNDHQAAMRKRFEHAITAQRQHQWGVCNEAVVAEAQAICLLLELTADEPSPDFAQAARETLRLEILDAAMNGDKSFERYTTEVGLYDLTVRWLSLPKGGLNAENSGASLLEWRTRFDSNMQQVRTHNKLKPLRLLNTDSVRQNTDDEVNIGNSNDDGDGSNDSNVNSNDHVHDGRNDDNGHSNYNSNSNNHGGSKG